MKKQHLQLRSSRRGRRPVLVRAMGTLGFLKVKVKAKSGAAQVSGENQPAYRLHTWSTSH